MTREPAPPALVDLLRRYQTAEAEFRRYLEGLLDGRGIPRDRLECVDDATGELLLRDDDTE